MYIFSKKHRSIGEIYVIMLNNNTAQGYAGTGSPRSSTGRSGGASPPSLVAGLTRPGSCDISLYEAMQNVSWTRVRFPAGPPKEF